MALGIKWFLLVLLESSLRRINTFSLRSCPVFCEILHVWVGFSLPPPVEESHTAPILLAPQHRQRPLLVIAYRNLVPSGRARSNSHFMTLTDIANPKGLTETDKCFRHPFIVSMAGPSDEDRRRVASLKCSPFAPEVGDADGSVI